MTSQQAIYLLNGQCPGVFYKGAADVHNTITWQYNRKIGEVLDYVTAENLAREAIERILEGYGRYEISASWMGDMGYSVYLTITIQ
jgi:hypothetical protein